ncbi:MAG: beta-propeller domain-containing protein [Mycobacterium sp.]|nr:beta-propeller domain-containing protein [Mycobacterium sp.]
MRSNVLSAVVSPAATTAAPSRRAVVAEALAFHPVLARIFNAPRPAVPAKAIQTIGTAVTAFFDSTANWVSGLPGGQVSQFLEGALLLVRRTFFNVFPALNTGQTTSQTGDAFFAEDELRAYLLDMAKQQYGGLFGSTVPVYGYGYGPYPEYLKIEGDVTSNTNTQVEGVDEADFVENDGQYIYTAHNGRLTITRADDLSVASESTLSGYVAGEYLSGDRLTVITQSGTGWYGPQVKMAYPGYWMQWNPQTTVTVYDVSDRSAPTVVSQTVFDGAYESSRSVDGVVYVVMERSVNLPAPHYTDTPIVYANSAVVQDDPAALSMIRYDPNAPVAYRTYETWDEYVARVGDDIVDLSLPHAYSVDAQGNTVDLGLVADAQDIVRPHASVDQNGRPSLLAVVSVDSASDAAGPADSVAGMVSAGGGTVYMTSDALYVANIEDRYTDAGYSNGTRIERFVVDGTDLEWQASGVVPGTLINQFAMDENDGHLRVATHDNSSDDNGIYVLDAGTLEEVGRLTGLAPGEQMYAVRYVGDTAYLVTFVRTDPLFAIDLSDPTAPTLLGELEVPGFSNYLQSVGDGLLLGIGQEREEGSWDTHVHATLFDVSDPTNMTAVDREYLDPGYQWSWSDAQFDHHALLYSEEDGLLVVPVAGSGYDPETGYRSGQYLKVLRVGPDGLEVVGEIHPTEPTLRTVRIGDVLYAVGDTTVTAYRISDLSQIGSNASAPSVV